MLNAGFTGDEISLRSMGRLGISADMLQQDLGVPETLEVGNRQETASTSSGSDIVDDEVDATPDLDEDEASDFWDSAHDASDEQNGARNGLQDTTERTASSYM